MPTARDPTFEPTILRSPGVVPRFRAGRAADRCAIDRERRRVVPTAGSGRIVPRAVFAIQFRFGDVRRLLWHAVLETGPEFRRAAPAPGAAGRPIPLDCARGPIRPLREYFRAL